MIKIYYKNDLTVKATVKKFNGDNIIQSPPYPNLKISHSILTSNVTQHITDYDDILNVNPSLGVYQRVIDSSIFSSDVRDYKFRITASIFDEYYFETFAVRNYLNSTESGITDTVEKTVQQTQNFYKQKLKEFFPDQEKYLMETVPKYKIMIESLGNWLDKIDQIIEELITLTRIEEISDEYLRYIAQIVGYETSDFTITNIALRNIIREIFSIYNLRGTQRGFENFFKSLGYLSIINERWYQGEGRIVDEKPNVGYVSASMASGEEWKYDYLFGREASYLDTNYAASAFYTGSTLNLNLPDDDYDTSNVFVPMTGQYLENFNVYVGDYGWGATSISGNSNITINGMSFGNPYGDIKLSPKGPISLNQQPLNVNPVAHSKLTWWQSFKPSYTGELVKLNMKLGGVDNSNLTTLNIYNGQGISGNLLYTQSNVLLSNNQVNGVYIDEPISMTVNQNYTFQFVSSSTLCPINVGLNAYSRGISDVTDYDWYFSTYMRKVRPWYNFADSKYNGKRRIYLPKSADFDDLGGYFDFYYDRRKFYNAFFNTTTEVVIAQDGSVYESSINPENIIVPGDDPALWRVNDLTGSTTFGSLDLVRQNDNEYHFVELYPSNIMGINLDPSTRFRAAGKYSKAERMQLIVESLKDVTLIPDIIDQMLIYIAFLKPVHIKLMLTLFQEYFDYWWEEDDYEYEYEYDFRGNVISSWVYVQDGNPVTLGNVPRDIDDVQFDIAFAGDDVSGVESATIGINYNTSSINYYEPLTMNGEWTVGEADYSDYRLDSNIWEMGDYGSIVAKYVNGSYPYYLNSVIASTVLDLNAQQSAFDLSQLLGITSTTTP